MTVEEVLKLAKENGEGWRLQSGTCNIRTAHQQCPLEAAGKSGRGLYRYAGALLKVPYDIQDNIIRAADNSIHSPEIAEIRKQMLEAFGLTELPECAEVKA